MFGIDVPCIARRGGEVDLVEAVVDVRDKTSGPNGILLRRCFADLSSSLGDADDTGFYCYRAIESLRHHCASILSLAPGDKAAQWGPS